ncbi:hypothetical protein [Paenibacillus nasutitermitis]|uniref:Uncharacterized protein n=1 Tax=Paenibacillus nasutitermitis TaxID=1652958 RepID=A0A916YXH5_9BACL|nr:hypothetical protein [Paenibacillus nasutitermitis]GGD66281.1 hypothetical protein GCM10010911_25080 [Paenibacillus nasutitermitis]
MLWIAYRRLNRNLTFLVYPIALDAIALGIGWLLAGFVKQPAWSLKLLLDMGLPSLSHLLNQPQLANTIDYLRLFGEEGAAVSAAAVILLLFVLCWAQGGYIAGLQTIATDGKPDVAHFIRHGRASFARFVLFRIIVFLAKISVTLGTTALFGTAGLFLSLLVFMTLRIVFIYLEFTMVERRLSWDRVLGQSRAYFSSALSDTAKIVVVLFASSGLCSFLLHRFWSPAAAIAGIIIYAYVMTGLQVALMTVLTQTRSES